MIEVNLLLLKLYLILHLLLLKLYLILHLLLLKEKECNADIINVLHIPLLQERGRGEVKESRRAGVRPKKADWQW